MKPLHLQSIPVNYGGVTETQSLAFYLRRTGPMISMAFACKDFWTVLVPQASWKFPSIRYMLVALCQLDKHLTSPTATTLDARNSHLTALVFYQKALACLTSCKLPPLTQVLVTSILAEMFEGISNQPALSAFHASAARRMTLEIGAENPNRLSIDHDMIMNVVQNELGHDQCRARFSQLANVQDDPPMPFGTLQEARIQLRLIAEALRTTSIVKDPHLHLARVEKHILRWQASFQAYRYDGAEPLSTKRQVFLLHNICSNVLRLQQLGESLTSQIRLIHRTLADTELIMEFEDVQELKPGLEILLDCIIRQASTSSAEFSLARKLRARLSAFCSPAAH